MGTEPKADLRDRVRASIERHQQLLDRLAREGDCLACVGTEGGCEKHRVRP